MAVIQITTLPSARNKVQKLVGRFKKIATFYWNINGFPQKMYGKIIFLSKNFCWSNTEIGRKMADG